MAIENTLWVEKYRPNLLKDYIGNDDLKRKAQKYIDNNEIQNILLFGSAGTGKTTFAKLLIKNIECDYLMLNASDENSIDTIRTKVKSFASSVSIKGSYKVIILDECLTGDTLVSIKRDEEYIKIPITEVNDKTDLVKSYDITTDTIEYLPFVFMEKEERELFEIEFENGEVVRCTGNHKWFTNDEEGKVIETTTDELYKMDNPFIFSISVLKIKSIKKLDYKEKVYDLHVPKNHNFFITDKEILTHNCDGLTHQAQKSLRYLIEEYSAHTRYILTCNYPENIIEALKSRCTPTEIKPLTKQEVRERMVTILNSEKIKYKDDDLDYVISLSFPDIRACIETLQQNVFINELSINRKTLTYTDYCSKILEILLDQKNHKTFDKSYESLKQILVDSKSRTFEELFSFLYENVNSIGSISTAIEIISEGQYKSSFAINKEIPSMEVICKLYNLMR